MEGGGLSAFSRRADRTLLILPANGAADQPSRSQAEAARVAVLHAVRPVIHIDGIAESYQGLLFTGVIACQHFRSGPLSSIRTSISMHSRADPPGRDWFWGVLAGGTRCPSCKLRCAFGLIAPRVPPPRTCSCSNHTGASCRTGTRARCSFCLWSAPGRGAQLLNRAGVDVQWSLLAPSKLGCQQRRYELVETRLAEPVEPTRVACSPADGPTLRFLVDAGSAHHAAAVSPKRLRIRCRVASSQDQTPMSMWSGSSKLSYECRARTRLRESLPEIS